MFASRRSGEHDEAIRAAAHRLSYNYRTAPVAQMDRAIASGAIGREFESLRAHHYFDFPVIERVKAAFFTHSSGLGIGPFQTLNINLLHLEHRLHDSLAFFRVFIRHQLGQNRGNDLPR